MKDNTVIHVSAIGGHQLSYQSTFARLLDAETSTGKISGKIFFKLVSSPNVLFCTIDDDYFGFICVIVLRTLLGKSTAGLFLRPLQCFKTERRIIYPMKRLAFKLMRRLPKLHVLSIIPHNFHPKLSEVSHDWIHDPQLWDLWLDGKPVLPDTDLSRRAKEAQQGRRILIYIGRGNRLKNFQEFVEYVEQHGPKILAVVAGSIDPKYTHHIARLKAHGAIVENRYVTDDEVLSLYNVADCAWCRYSADYDQASGVFGRALQTGVAPLVRAGSILEKQLDEGELFPLGMIARSVSVLKKCQFF
jgi:glycosyltransferase involved in cell wall biosynthesis